MPHFDRTDLLESGICHIFFIGLGWVPQLVRPPRADLRNFSIFSEILVWAADREKPIFLTFESEKIFKNNFVFSFVVFPENMILQLHFGIFTSCVLPVDQKRQGSEILIHTFSF